jgi:hypothetical protein
MTLFYASLRAQRSHPCSVVRRAYAPSPSGIHIRRQYKRSSPFDKEAGGFRWTIAEAYDRGMPMKRKVLVTGGHQLHRFAMYGSGRARYKRDLGAYVSPHDLTQSFENRSNLRISIMSGASPLRVFGVSKSPGIFAASPMPAASSVTTHSTIPK